MNVVSGDVQVFTPCAFLWLMPFFPLLGAVANGIFGRALERRLGRRAIHAVAVGVMALSSLAAVAAVAALARLPPEGRFLLDTRWEMLAVGPLRVDLAFALDPLAAVMVLVITMIGTLIHVYAVGYMAHDEAGWRFFAYLNLFVFSMLLLVLADSLLLMFFGWEGVGLCSYLLIGFWYRDLGNARAARKAFITNRVGDWGFLVGISLLFWGLGNGAPTTVTVPVSGEAKAAAAQVTVGPTLVFRELHDQLSLRSGDGTRVVAAALAGKSIWGLPLLLVIGVALFWAAAGKSAQIPLHVWLPDAMAGPTPVSALIHAATMVTAGIYLVARLSFLFALTPAALTAIAAIGLLTAFMGATIAVVQTDIKKVLAYSTISQLGFMFLAAGVGAYWVAVFHLVTHACFKACLFLAAGSAIHGVRAAADTDTVDPQDLRNMGGLQAVMPRTHLAYLLGCISIAGFPIAAGFYSKDEILWRAFTQGQVFVPGPLLWAVALATAGLTSFYMFRSYYLAFWGGAHPAAAHIHESGDSMTRPLAVLAAAAVVTGPLLGWPQAWGGRPWLERFLAPVFSGSEAAGHASGGPGALVYLFQLLSVGVAAAGWLAARALYKDLAGLKQRLGQVESWRSSRLGKRIDRLVRRKYGFDEAYEVFILAPLADITHGLAYIDRHLVDGAVHLVARAGRLAAAVDGWIDRRIVDGAVNALSTATLMGGRRLGRLQTGRINNYVLGITVGVVILVAISWLAT